MKSYFLDTNTIIYALNLGINLSKARYLVSIITEIELLSYSDLSKSEEQNLRKLLSKFEIINISQEIKERTIQLRKHYELKLPDTIIVASALENNATLVTSDKQLLKSGINHIIDLKDLQ